MSSTCFHDILPDAAWQGHRCFIIGGGPSLKGFDFNRLQGTRTIAINRSIEFIDANIWFSAAPRVLIWILTGALGKRLRDKFINSSATLKCLVSNLCDMFPDNILLVRRYDHDDELSESIRDGIYLGQRNQGCNSGLGALNLALCLGADPIYLLGFDMHEQKKAAQSWHHVPYPAVEDAAVYRSFVRAFDGIAEQAKMKSRIINLNSRSALRCFQFGDVDETLP